MNLTSDLDYWATHDPLKAALRYEDSVLSYSDLDQWSSTIAADLRALGIGEQDRVGVLAGSDTTFVAIVYGIWKIGAIVVLLNPHLPGSEVAYQTVDSGAGVIVIDDNQGRWDAASSLDGVQVLHAVRRSVETIAAVATKPTDIAVIAYTSGTTGRAKGVAHTHQAIRTQLEMVGEHYAATSEEEILCLLPLFLLSIFIVGPLLALFAGATCRVMARYHALDAARAIERDRTTIAAAVPLFFHDLGQLADEHGLDIDLTSLRVVTSGGAPLPENVRDRLEQRFGFRLIQLYGMTEGPAILTGDPMTGERRIGSVGTALPHIRISIVDDNDREVPAGIAGEVCASALVEGPFAGRYATMARYWGLPELTAATLRGGKLHTGDVGYLDDQGFLYLVGRTKDTIIRGGMNIYPREIEEVLAGNENVAECVVIGAPHQRYGEVPVAYVRTNPGARTTPDELLDFANSRLSGSHKLDAVHLVEEFPRNSLGKVLKYELIRNGRSQ